MHLFLLLTGIFLGTFVFGILLKKIRVPWIFGALITGLFFASSPYLKSISNNETFTFLAWLGMYFLLFLIGFELDLEKIKKLGKFIIKSTFFIIFFEALFGSLVIHFVFNYEWLISILVALSFATVGEAVLIPILDEFKLIKSKLGQTILGIGSFDDIIEVMMIILAVLMVTILNGYNQLDLVVNKVVLILISLAGLFVLLLLAVNLKNKISLFKNNQTQINFILLLAILFLLLSLTEFSDMLAIGALFAGILVKVLLNQQKVSIVENKIKTLTYDFFGPIFFFWVAMSIDTKYLLTAPLLILLVVGVSYGAKILGSWLVTKKELGGQSAIFMGLSLGVRFSTSIVIIKYLFENNLIGSKIYSVLITSTMFSILVPFILALLIKKWRINKNV